MVNDISEAVLDSMQRELNSVEALYPSVPISQIIVERAETIKSATQFPRERKVSSLSSYKIRISNDDSQFIHGAGLSSLSELSQISPSVKRLVKLIFNN